MRVSVSVVLAEGETFSPSEETAAKAILRACGGTLAADTCQLQVVAPSEPVVVGNTEPPPPAAEKPRG